LAIPHSGKARATVKSKTIIKLPTVQLIAIPPQEDNL